MLLKMERKLVLVRLRDGMSGVGGCNCRVDSRHPFEVLVVSEVHGRIGRLRLLLELSPGRGSVKRRSKSVIVLGAPTRRGLPGLDVRENVTLGDINGLGPAPHKLTLGRGGDRGRRNSRGLDD